MALSDHPSRKGIAVKKHKAYYTDAQKLEAVKTYLVYGNLLQTARLLNIDDRLMRMWRTTQWWKELEQDLRIQEDFTLSNRLQKIVTKTFDTVEDRLEHGDWVYDQKDQALRRKPVLMRDAHKVGLDLLTKRQLLIDKPKGNLETEEGVDAKLAKLAERFAEMVNSNMDKKRTVEMADVVDVEIQGDNNAIYDQRETGLQEGAGVGTQGGT